MNLSRISKSASIRKDLVNLLALITFLLAISAAFAILWTLSIQPSIYNLVPLILLFWFSCVWLVARNLGRKLLIICCFFTILELVAVVLISSLFKDNSWDGNQYQSEGPLQIFLGWNPFRELIFPAKWDTSWAVWLDSLPKFGWQLSAFILHMGGDQASSKILSLVGLLIIARTVALLCSCYSLMGTKRVALILAAISFPIGISQFPTGYQDGFSSAWTISLILLIFANKQIVDAGFNSWPLIAFLSIGALLTKYTQIIPVTVTLIIYFLFSWRVPRITVKVVSIFAPLFFLGFNPYITNFLSFGNPLYPMSSKNYLKGLGFGKLNLLQNSTNANIQENIYFYQTASNIYGEWQPLQFLKSLFSKTAHVNNQIAAEFKFPGFFSRAEFEYFTNPDPRMGGFGPIFSLVLMVIVTGVFFKKEKDSRLAIFLVFAITLSVLFTPYPWWARYIGYAYSIIIMFLFTLIASKAFKAQTAAFVAIALLIFQTLITTYGHLQKENSYQRPIYAITSESGISTPIELRDQAFSGYRLDWMKNDNFVYENIEVDFFFNQIWPALSDSEIKLMETCYKIDKSVVSLIYPGKQHTDDNFFNNSGLLKIRQECDIRTLSKVQKLWANIPFRKIKILS